MEAINSEKSWEEIKDLLRLKLCSTNIHTHTSCFMDIQQQEKKSLAAYIHQFKLNPRDAISQMMLPLLGFCKGIKNAHSLATHIYDKKTSNTN